MIITVDDILRAKDQRDRAALARKLAEQCNATAAQLELEAHDTLELATAQMGEGVVQQILAQADELMPANEQKFSVIITADLGVTGYEGLMSNVPMGPTYYADFGLAQSGQGNETP